MSYPFLRRAAKGRPEDHPAGHPPILEIRGLTLTSCADLRWLRLNDRIDVRVFVQMTRFDIKKAERNCERGIVRLPEVFDRRIRMVCMRMVFE
jgi:hypothetical protein